MVSLKYSDIGTMAFAQAVQKIAATPTNGKNACRIRRTVQELTKAREAIKAEYKSDIVDKFSKKDDAGKLIPAEDHPEGFQPLDGKEEELNQAQKAFGDKIAVLECFPFTIETVQDVKMSATEMEALKGLFVDDEVDAPAQMSNVKNLR